MNLLILDGRLTDNPNFTPNQEESKQRANFSLAHNHTSDKATFFRCTAWGKTAGKIAKLQKGQRLLIQGDVEENEWTGNDGSKQRDKQVNVRSVTYIDFPPEQPAAAPQPHQGYGQAPASQAAPAAPQYYTDPAGNVYQMINGQWALIRPAGTVAPMPPAPPAAPAAPAQPALPFGTPPATRMPY
jgi:single-stranded DNA-binding protein